MTTLLLDDGLNLHAAFLHGNEWEAVDFKETGGCSWSSCHETGVSVVLVLKEDVDGWSYELSFDAPWPTRVRLGLAADGTGDAFHLIPANIHGDNNLAHAEAGHYPNLTDEPHESPFSSPLWEFRADRAPYPVSALCLEDEVVAITVDPYSATDERRDGFIANGLYAELPSTCGVSLGYGNFPVTFINKEEHGVPTCHRVSKATTSGCIYRFAGDRRAIHNVFRREYKLRGEQPGHDCSIHSAAQALCDAFVETNWSPEMDAYSNMTVNLDGHTYLRPWRPLIEIGWTGGGPLAYPFIRAERQLGLNKAFFGQAASGRKLLDRMAAARNSDSGLLYDLTEAWIIGEPPGNHVNGWWTYYPLCKDVHGAYTNGSAVYYLLKSALELRDRGEEAPQAWVNAALGTLDTVVGLQRDDGNFGFSYALDKPEVNDWDGFAGCWFAAAAVLAWQWNEDERFLGAARKALAYYREFVKQLNCWGTPMDTWKSVDEEGNLAFIKAARHLFEATEEQEYLDAVIDGANYELLWRYGYRTRPPNPPLNDGGWNACGGSITSVSNPHAHPMGLIVTGDLLWLANETGDGYWKERAEDGVRWIVQCMELYPKKSGYGHFGVLTERFCPSDGLLSERFDDGTPSSIWFTYNGWAAAAALEGILDWLDMKGEHYA